MINAQGREFCKHDFTKNAFIIGICSDAYDLIAFKLGVMLDTTELCSWIKVQMTDSSQGHRVMRQLESVVKLPELAQTFYNSYVREMSAKMSCKFGKCGSF